ncbi:MAG TPA: glycosyltransferase family 2 protein [Phycisphaerae bacterium]|nr:glycosyltransferase family 2 protein [Phycisphaerae bacterium]
MPEPLFALIVVTHNSKQWLPGFFKTWSTGVPTLPAEIVVADSGSTDGTRRVAREISPSARILECGNIGYGAAANRGVAATSAPWILLCNPDLEFDKGFESDFLQPMMQKPPHGAGCIAPGLINEDETGQYSVGDFPTVWGILRDQFREPEKRKYVLRSKEEMFDWATGAILLICREHWNAVGGFDEKFFLYAEEVDFQRRLAHHGLRTRLVREVGVRHLSPAAGRATAQIKRYSARGMLRYFAKHGTLVQLLAYRLLALASLRLPPSEALAPKKTILDTPTGP